MQSVVETRYGLGLPLSLRPKRNLITYTRVNYAGRPVYQLGISFFKIALLISYLRLLRGTDRKAYRMAIWLTIVFVSCSHLSTALLLLFSCNPVWRAPGSAGAQQRLVYPANFASRSISRGTLSSQEPACRPAHPSPPMLP